MLTRALPLLYNPLGLVEMHSLLSTDFDQPQRHTISDVISSRQRHRSGGDGYFPFHAL